MNVASGPRLAAAVTNAGVFDLASGWGCSSGIQCHHHVRAGGIGVIGGLTYSPKMLRQGIDELRSQLENKDGPFGVDLAIPQIGGGARKTNVRPP